MTFLTKSKKDIAKPKELETISLVGDDSLVSNWAVEGQTYLAPLEITPCTKHITVRLEMPAMKKKDFNIELQDNILTISGYKEERKKEESEDGLASYSEIFTGKFKRSVNVGPDINFEKAYAEYEDGVLTVVLPRKKYLEAKKINIL